MSASASTSTAAAAAAAQPDIAALRQSLLAALRTRLRPVPHIDTDAARYAQDRGAFKAYLLGRFGLPSLVAQGEEGSVRRSVHAHLISADPEYRRLVEEELPALDDPWVVDPASTEAFRPLASRVTSASQRDAYLPAARAALAAVDKVLGQLSVGVEKARGRVVASPDDAAARAALAAREAKWGEMVGKRGRLEAVIAVLARIEPRLVEARAAVLSRLARRAAGGGVGDAAAAAVALPPPPPRDTTAWGKAAEREAEAAVEAVLAEVNAGREQGEPAPLRLLSSVLLKALDGGEMVRVRAEALAEGWESVYAGDVERPKGGRIGLGIGDGGLIGMENGSSGVGCSTRLTHHCPSQFTTNNQNKTGEIDLLVVRPSPDDSHTLQVVLAIEVKRSLDEVATDCLKLRLLLDMCRRVPPPSRHAALRFACGGGGGGALPRSEEGYALDFSTVDEPAAAAVYVAKRGGPTLRAASKLLSEAVQLLRTAPSSSAGNDVVGGEEEERVVERRLRAFYAPDFVGDGLLAGGAAVAAQAEADAEAARDGVVDELWERFCRSGLGPVEARLGRVARALMGEAAAAAKGELRTVFTLGRGGGGGGDG